MHQRGAYAEALGAAGNVDEGLAEAEAALRRAEELDYLWLVPELLRIQGSLSDTRIAEDHATAEQLFSRAIEQAHGQRALYWELCAAVGLAELWQTQRRHAEAHALLAPICQGFTEGFATPVLLRANALLQQTEVGG